MKIEITTTAKGIETANYLLSMAIDQAEQLSQDKLKSFDLSKTSLKEANNFRKQLIKSFLNASSTDSESETSQT